MISYHPTVALPLAQVWDRTVQARRQDDQVLDWWRQHPTHIYTAEEVHKYMNPNWPLGSTRRALSNLKERGHLERLSRTVPGSLGHPAHLYRLVQP